jgi:hypothetical protein
MEVRRIADIGGFHWRAEPRVLLSVYQELRSRLNEANRPQRVSV